MNRTLKNLAGILVALLIFIIAASVIYVYIIEPMIDDVDPSPDDQDLTLTSLDGTVYRNGDNVFFSEGLNTFSVSSHDVTITIAANPEYDFDYSVGEFVYRWKSVTDLSGALFLTKYDNSFSISIPNEDTLEELIARSQSTTAENVSILTTVPDSAAIFLITIREGSDSATFTAAYGFAVSEIELDQSQIIFG